MEVRRGYAAGWRLTTQKEEWSLEKQTGWALAGFTCAGAGLATIIPNTFAAAGNIEGSAPGPSLAVVTTAGYVGFLAGPPLIGFVAQLSTIRAALWILVVLSGLSAFASTSMKRTSPLRRIP